MGSLKQKKVINTVINKTGTILFLISLSIHSINKKNVVFYDCILENSVVVLYFWLFFGRNQQNIVFFSQKKHFSQTKQHYFFCI